MLKQMCDGAWDVSADFIFWQLIKKQTWSQHHQLMALEGTSGNTRLPGPSLGIRGKRVVRGHLRLTGLPDDLGRTGTRRGGLSSATVSFPSLLFLPWPLLHPTSSIDRFSYSKLVALLYNVAFLFLFSFSNRRIWRPQSREPENKGEGLYSTLSVLSPMCKKPRWHGALFCHQFQLNANESGCFFFFSFSPACVVQAHINSRLQMVKNSRHATVGAALGD